MKSALLLLAFSVPAMAEEKVEICKNVSQVTDLKACDIGSHVIFILDKQMTFVSKPLPSPEPKKDEKKK